MKISTTPLVSIVISTRNSAAFLKDCLSSIREQTYKRIEIIVVDNNSQDDTKHVARQYTRLVYNKGPERSTQRNFGAKKIAKGSYLLFLDSDMRVSKHLISNCVLKMNKDQEIVGSYINEIVVGNSFWSSVRRFERGFYNGTVIDGLRFIRRDIFLKAGGFDERLYACEDWDLDKRIKKNGRTVFISTPLYHNESKFSIKNYLEKKYYYTDNFNVYISKWGKDDPDIRKQFGPAYRLFGVFVENGKWKQLTSHPFHTIPMIALRLLAGWKYVLIRLRVDL